MMSFVGVARHCRESRPAGYSVRNGSKADISRQTRRPDLIDRLRGASSPQHNSGEEKYAANGDECLRQLERLGVSCTDVVVKHPQPDASRGDDEASASQTTS